MFDTNKFKKSVKSWVKSNTDATVNDFVDFCEEQIPSSHYAANKWLIEQSVSWYKHVLNQRRASRNVNLFDEAND